MKLLLVVLALLLVATIFTTFRRSRRAGFVLHDFDTQRVLPLRGILALLIVMHHFSQKVSPLGIPVIREFGLWGGVVVGIFFFITGYGLMVSYVGKGTAYLDTFFSRRFGKLLPSFIIATVGWLVVECFWTGENAFRSVAGLLHGHTPLPNSWFVYAILLFYAFFYWAARRHGRHSERIIVALGLAVTVYCVVVRVIHWGGWWYTSSYALVAGVAYAWYEPKVKSWLYAKPMRVAAVQAAVLCMMGGIYGVYWITGKGISLVMVSAAVLAPLSVVFAIYALGMAQGRVLRFLGRISYEIYLVHGCFLLVFLDMKEEWVLYLLVVFAATIPVAWALQSIPALARGRRWPR